MNGFAALAIGLVVPIAARAEDGASHPLDTVLKALDLKTDVDRPADFVEASRPKGDPDYLPVGTPHPDRTIKVKTPDELKAAEADLDAARIRHDKIAGRKPPPDGMPAKAKPGKPPKATQN